LKLNNFNINKTMKKDNQIIEMVDFSKLELQLLPNIQLVIKKIANIS
jgi:hypothetical protein